MSEKMHWKSKRKKKKIVESSQKKYFTFLNHKNDFKSRRKQPGNGVCLVGRANKNKN